VSERIYDDYYLGPCRFRAKTGEDPIEREDLCEIQRFLLDVMPSHMTSISLHNGDVWEKTAEGGVRGGEAKADQ